jgi:hypothetical protein
MLQWSSPVLRHAPLSPSQAFPEYLLTQSTDMSIKYRVNVVDVKSVPSEMDKVCGVLLVPQGREHEYLFGDNEGRKCLTKDSGYARMVFVTRERGAGNVALDVLKEEISQVMLDLLPRGFAEIKLPFISVAQSMGKREVVWDQGNVIVEDVKTEELQEFWERRLLFRSNLNLIQSEIRMDGEKKYLFGYLPCGYQKAIIAGLGFLGKSEGDGVIIGLGGGVLASFFAHYLSSFELDIVELDQDIAEIAQKYFGFATSATMRLYIMDGLEYIKSDAKEVRKKRNFIIIDVNTNDASVALSCPPSPFVDLSFLASIKELLLPGGLCIVNVVTRDGNVRDGIQKNLQEVFGKCVYQIKIAEDVNRVFVAANVQSYSDYEFNNIDSVLENLPEISSKDLEPQFRSELEEMLRTVSYPELLSKAEKERLRKKAQKAKKKNMKKK